MRCDICNKLLRDDELITCDVCLDEIVDTICTYDQKEDDVALLNTWVSWEELKEEEIPSFQEEKEEQD